MATSQENIRELIDQIGKYTLGDENTDGMNAYAFKAKHLHLDRDVFLKIYDASPDRTDLFEEPRFLVEATAQQGGPSHLVEVLDAEKLGDEWVLVAMEYVDGGSILKAIENGPLPLMDAIGVAKGILTGLSVLHDTLLVHRDLKPANILLGSRDGVLHPKIGDFGSVARLSSAEVTVKASRHSALYVPPEGWQEPSEYSFRSDIYQVGLVLSEMVHGPLPYDDACYLDRTAKSEIKDCGCKIITELDPFDRCQIVDAALARRSAARRILLMGPKQPYPGRKLKQIINRATNPDPTKRYGKPIDMLNELNGLSFPNWMPCDDHHLALNCNGWDWKIECKNKRDGSQEFYAKRSRQGAGKFIKKHTASSHEEAFKWVSDQLK